MIAEECEKTVQEARGDPHIWTWNAKERDVSTIL